jgi:hypothetical protein
MICLLFLISEYFKCAITISQDEIPSLILVLLHFLMPFTIIKVSIVILVAMSQVVHIILMLASNSFLVGFCNISLFYTFNNGGLIGIDQDMINLNCMT